MGSSIVFCGLVVVGATALTAGAQTPMFATPQCLARAGQAPYRLSAAETPASVAINTARSVALVSRDVQGVDSFGAYRLSAAGVEPSPVWTCQTPTPVSMNADGVVAFSQGASAPARWLGGSSVDAVPAFGWEVSTSAPDVNDLGFMAMTVSAPPNTGRQVARIFDPVLRINTIVERTVGESFISPWSWMGPVSMNNQRLIAAVFRAGLLGQTGASQPDEVRIVNPTGSGATVARDVDADAASNVVSFFPELTLTNAGKVAFIADLVGGARGVFLADAVTTVVIAISGQAPGVSGVTLARPDANAYGQVVFLGLDATGTECVFVGDGVQLKVVARRGDVTPCDGAMPGGVQRLRGVGSSPTFVTPPSINELGDVALVAQTTAIDSETLVGTSVYSIVSCRADVNGDGVVSTQDMFDFLTAWFSVTRAGDFSRDGVITIQDMFSFISAWFAPC